eukprot:3472856-Pleurochrysis_carterae.AAC.1
MRTARAHAGASRDRAKGGQRACSVIVLTKAQPDDTRTNHIRELQSDSVTVAQLTDDKSTRERVIAPLCWTLFECNGDYGTHLRGFSNAHD